MCRLFAGRPSLPLPSSQSATVPPASTLFARLCVLPRRLLSGVGINIMNIGARRAPRPAPTRTQECTKTYNTNKNATNKKTEYYEYSFTHTHTLHTHVHVHVRVGGEVALRFVTVECRKINPIHRSVRGLSRERGLHRLVDAKDAVVARQPMLWVANGMRHGVPRSDHRY